MAASFVVVYVIQNYPDLHKLFVRFLSQNDLISLGFSMNMNVYMHSYHMLFTTFTSVLYPVIWLYRIYNISPSARARISDTTRPLML